MAKGKKDTPPALSLADEKLWQQVAGGVKPLTSRPPGQPIPPRRMIERKDEQGRMPSEWFAGAAPEPRAEIDRRTQRRLTAGMKEIDRSVDLHGMTQDQAYSKLVSVVEAAVLRGDKVLLVVTGKGGARFSQLGPHVPVAYRTRDEFDQFGGVLKQAVPVWLAGPDLRPFIEAYGPAAPGHGGEGALYIMLRKRAPGSKKRRALS